MLRCLTLMVRAAVSRTNTAGIEAVNLMLGRFECSIPIELMRIKYLNNMVEEDYRASKKGVLPMLGCTSFASASGARSDALRSQT